MISENIIDQNTLAKAKEDLPPTVFGQLMLSDMLYLKIQNMQMEDTEKNEVNYILNLWF